MNDKQLAVMFDFMEIVLHSIAANVHESERLTILPRCQEVFVDVKAERSKLDIFPNQPALQDPPAWEKL